MTIRRVGMWCLPFVLLAAGCGGTGNGAPSEREIIQAITDIAKQGGISPNVIGLGDPEDVKVEKLKVIQVGTLQTEPLLKTQYWPVKVHIAGSYNVRVPYQPPKAKTFDSDAEYSVSKDPYGKWGASPISH